MSEAVEEVAGMEEEEDADRDKIEEEEVTTDKSAESELIIPIERQQRSMIWKCLLSASKIWHHAEPLYSVCII